MASIVENIIGDRAIQLGNEEFVRKLSFGGGWNSCRVGVLMRIFGDLTVTNQRFQIGFNYGDQDTFMSNNCAGYVGVKYNYNGNFTYESANKRYNCGSGYVNSHVQKQGSTISDSLYAGSSTQMYAAAATSPAPHMWLLAGSRTTATTYTLQGTYVTAANLAFSPTTGDLLAIMESEAALSNNFCTAGISKVSTGSLPSSMDTLSIYWNHNIPVVEIYAICVVAYY